MIRLSQVMMQVGHTDAQLIDKCAKALKVSKDKIEGFQIVKQSIDARKRPDIYYSYIVDIKIAQEEKVLRASKNKQASIITSKQYVFPECGDRLLEDRIVIIGSGPAGLFCGLYLAKAGYKPIILERGQDVDNRAKEVRRFWEGGSLNPDSNVQFGEGGAGTFSDGKLNTLVKDKDARNFEVLSAFVENGANANILYESKPHLGTDCLIDIVKNIRKKIIEFGGEVYFNSKVTKLLLSDSKAKVEGVLLEDGSVIKSSNVVLAIGHSARDTFEMLHQIKIPMEAKDFAVGFRVEHPQKLINKSQYGVEEFKGLSAAPYKVVAKTSIQRGVYSFCMCPGGYVVNASSEKNMTVVNGMSYSKRDGSNANSAIIVSVSTKDYGRKHPLAGIEFQRQLEAKAYEVGKGAVPIQRYGDFKKILKNKGVALKENLVTQEVKGYLPQIKGEYRETDLTQIFSEEINKAFVEGMEHFGKIIPGFNHDLIWLEGVESRTSSAVRIPRNKEMQSSIEGLYPCGEGAGYAGGITSASIDGMRVAEEIAKIFRPFY